MYVVTEMHMGKKIRNYSYDYGVNFKWWNCKLQTEGKITWKVPVGKVQGDKTVSEVSVIYNPATSCLHMVHIS